MDWAFRSAGPNADAEQAIKTIGAVLCGRRSYNVGRNPDTPPEGRKIYGGAWSGPVFVLTHEPPNDEEDPAITFTSGDIRHAVATALAAAGEGNVLIIGANVAQQCIDEGLVDEILVHLAPLLPGDGVRFFGRLGNPVNLETTRVSQSGQVANLRLRVVR